MTRGRHRHSSASPATLPLAAVGALAVCGAALAMVGSDARLLRLGVSCSLAATVSVAVLLRAREREHARELANSLAARRRDEAALHDEVQSLTGTLHKLNREIGTLRDELAEVTAAHSAAVLVRTAPSRPAALTRDAFLQAAAALGTAPEQPTAGSEAEGDERSLALQPIELAPVRGGANPAREGAAGDVGDDTGDPLMTAVAAAAGAEEPAVEKPESTGNVAAPDADAPVEEPGADTPASEERTVAEPAAEVPVAAEPVAEVAAAEVPTVALGQPVEPVEAAVAEAGDADEARDERGDEQADAQVIDLTAHDDTQPLRLAGVRRRA